MKIEIDRLLRLLGLAPKLTRIRQGSGEMPALSTALVFNRNQQAERPR